MNGEENLSLIKARRRETRQRSAMRTQRALSHASRVKRTHQNVFNERVSGERGAKSGKKSIVPAIFFFTRYFVSFSGSTVRYSASKTRS